MEEKLYVSSTVTLNASYPCRKAKVLSGAREQNVEVPEEPPRCMPLLHAPVFKATLSDESLSHPDKKAPGAGRPLTLPPPNSLLPAPGSAPHFLFNADHSLKSFYLHVCLFIVWHLSLPPDLPAQRTGRSEIEVCSILLWMPSTVHSL